MFICHWLKYMNNFTEAEIRALIHDELKKSGLVDEKPKPEQKVEITWNQLADAFSNVFSNHPLSLSRQFVSLCEKLGFKDAE